jgi:hypothetical protein
MLRKAMENAETRKRWSTAEGWFRRGAWLGYATYLVYVKESLQLGMMKRIMLKKDWRSGVLYKLSHLRHLP